MKERKIMFCQIHRETEFAERKDGSKIRWKCLKCETEATQKRREKIKVMAIAYKGGKCQCCGYDKCTQALEFHHVDPTQKDFGLGAKGYTRSWEKNKEELDKCVMVCANCHREIHYNIIPCPTKIIKDDESANKAASEFDKT